MNRRNRIRRVHPMEDYSWVERFQTLISGILAICAALIAAVVIYISAQALEPRTCGSTDHFGC